MKLFRKLIYDFKIRLKSRGLSREHIKLCAEGAKRKLNLSGKRTETHCLICAVFERSSLWAALFVLQELGKKELYHVL